MVDTDIRRKTSAEAKGQTEARIRAAYVVLTNVGSAMSHNKVVRIVRRYEAEVEGNGWTFFDYLANAIALDADQRRSALRNPEVARVLTYADPTGETAVARAMRETP